MRALSPAAPLSRAHPLSSLCRSPSTHSRRRALTCAYGSLLNRFWVLNVTQDEDHFLARMNQIVLLLDRPSHSSSIWFGAQLSPGRTGLLLDISLELSLRGGIAWRKEAYILLHVCVCHSSSLRMRASYASELFRHVGKIPVGKKSARKKDLRLPGKGRSGSLEGRGK